MALQLCEQRYGDFGPTLAAEKLTECHGIAVSVETVRGGLLATGVTHFQRQEPARIGPGGNGELTWEHSANSMARTMTGLRGADLAAC